MTLYKGYETYGDKDAGDVVIRRCCDGSCHLPGKNRSVGKMSGTLDEVQLCLANLGPYVAGGWPMERIMRELGVGCITGMICIASHDPMGCKIIPSGCELVLCFDDVKTELLGKVSIADGNGTVDFTNPFLQVWKDGAEVEAGWEAPADLMPWVGLFLQ